MPDTAKPAEPLSACIRRRVVLSAASIVLFVVVALGLAVRVGFGPKGRYHGLDGSAAPDATGADAEPWRLPPSEYQLDMVWWDYNAAPTTRTYDFIVSAIDAFPDGVLRKVLVVNGQYPGPLIRANRGDRLLINVTNTMVHSTTMHWHGLYQNGTNWMDGVPGVTQCPIAAGRSFLYNFTVDNQYGTYWYHSHSDAQRMDGLFGALIIHAPEEVAYQQRYGYTHDQIVLLQDYYHDLSYAYLPAYLAPDNENNEPVPDNGLMQGTNYFNCSAYGADSGRTCYDNSTRAVIAVDKGARYRFRLLNVGAFATFQFTIDNHTLAVIEGDSTMTEPLAATVLQIAPAQRYSFLLDANQSASTNYWIRAMMDTHCFTKKNPVLDATTHAVLAYRRDSSAPPTAASVPWRNVPEPRCRDLNASLLVPSEARAAPPADMFYAIQFSFMIRDYMLDRGYVNGTSWRPSAVPTLNHVVPQLRGGDSAFSAAGAYHVPGLDSQYVLNVPENAVVDILLQNFDDGAHPFHLHGYNFWVMASSENLYFPYETDYYASIATTNPMRRDTVTVAPYGWTLIRVPADNPGLWAFHCHIAWHVEAGLFLQLQVRDDVMRHWTLPDDVLALCNAGP